MNKKVADNNTITSDKFREIEFDNLLSSISSLDSIRVQTGVFFGTANLTVLGIGIGTKQSGLFFIAALAIWIMIIIDISTRRNLAAYYYRTFQILALYQHNDEEFILNILPGSIKRYSKELLKIQDPIARRTRLYKLAYQIKSPFGFYFPLVIGLMEIIAGIIMLVFLKWPLL